MRCDSCNRAKRAEANRLYREAHPGENYARVKAWREANPEKRTEQNRRYKQTESGKAKHIRDTQAYRAKYREKHRARNQLAYALLTGKVSRPTECEKCGKVDTPYEDGRSSLSAHHADYGKPLDVLWVCAECHLQIHS